MTVATVEPTVERGVFEGPSFLAVSVDDRRFAQIFDFVRDGANTFKAGMQNFSDRQWGGTGSLQGGRGYNFTTPVPVAGDGNLAIMAGFYQRTGVYYVHVNGRSVPRPLCDDDVSMVHLFGTTIPDPGKLGKIANAIKAGSGNVPLDKLGVYMIGGIKRHGTSPHLSYAPETSSLADRFSPEEALGFVNNMEALVRRVTGQSRYRVASKS